MTFKFSGRSQEHIRTLHPSLQRVVSTALGLGFLDFSVLSGGRTQKEQQKLYDQGRLTKGPIVTWTLDSKHIIQSDGYSRAFDAAPYPIDWNNITDFAMLGALMFRAAYIEQVKIEWGGFFDHPDWGHFQLGG